jgi:spermidine synthase
VGSWLSRFFERQLPAHFLRIELLVALVGGGMPALLFVANAWQPEVFRVLLYGLVLLVGILVGLEIPRWRCPSPSRCCWCRSSG